jgi:maltose phosphorylase
MNPNFKIDEWKIIEEGFDQRLNRASESIFSIGNGHMGQRANFEEYYSGDTLRGSYIAGVYYPDKTRVGWWKNGYPKYFAKVLNSPNWIGINIKIDGELLDLANSVVTRFRRELNMKEGSLRRSFTARLYSGVEIEVVATRFMSCADFETGAVRYTVKTINREAVISAEPYIDADVFNEDSNYNEYFWEEVDRKIDQTEAVLVNATRKTDFHVAVAMKSIIKVNGNVISDKPSIVNSEKYISRLHSVTMKVGDVMEVDKFAAVLSSENHPKKDLMPLALKKVAASSEEGFENLLSKQRDFWATRWKESDVVIEGDPAAQQAIRFNIFHLYQTYMGDDERLNIGPKGFTGEKYGGSTYWDTEAFALPFYLNTSDSSVARNLLLYRYHHLEKAIKNASILGFNNGAALFPMVTMNGEECHNEWEITFEEIHRNGAIAYAIYNYINHTGDDSYLIDYGLEVLIAISRFWSQRVSYSSPKDKFVILGVTGPNEYENNVNNNWYTNLLASWTLKYTISAIDQVRKNEPAKFKSLAKRIKYYDNESKRWGEIAKNIYLPEDKGTGVFLQQEGYLDKVQMMAEDVPVSERPINQHWSWDRILRSTLIKQADVLQGIYMFEDDFDKEAIKRNYDFYEPRTVHESSLSPSVYSVMACSIGETEKAYQLYLRTARLDLDDYNQEVKEGLHITSMAGTWLSIVEGFGGMRIRDNRLHLNPIIPAAWKCYSFKMRFRNSLLCVEVSKGRVIVKNLSNNTLPVTVFGESSEVEREQEKTFIK